MLVVIELSPELIAARGDGDGQPLRASLILRQPDTPACPDPSGTAILSTTSVNAMAPSRRATRQHRARRHVLRFGPLTAAAVLAGTAVVASGNGNPATQPSVADRTFSAGPARPIQTVKVDTPRFVPIDAPVAEPTRTTRAAPPDRPSAGTSALTTSGPAALGLLLPARARMHARDVPGIARRAYVRAAVRADSARPSCGLTWQSLAAVGFLASDNGRAGRTHLTADGEATPAMFGNPLDGRTGYEYTDSDGGRLDHSPTFDRGVGPLMLLPYAWRFWAADGNGDGVEDPQQIDDAALAAADFLCAATTTMRTSAGAMKAFHAFDPQPGFAQAAVSVARRYAGLPVTPNKRAGHRKRTR